VPTERPREPGDGVPTLTGSNHVLSHRSCHPCATSDGQLRYRADNHGHYHAAAELAVSRSSSVERITRTCLIRMRSADCRAAFGDLAARTMIAPDWPHPAPCPDATRTRSQATLGRAGAANRRSHAGNLGHERTANPQVVTDAPRQVHSLEARSHGRSQSTWRAHWARAAEASGCPAASPRSRAVRPTDRGERCRGPETASRPAAASANLLERQPQTAGQWSMPPGNPITSTTIQVPSGVEQAA
jgi:hypothetical protein